MKGEEIRRVLFLAGIHVTEASELFKVTRHALYNWFNGKTPRSKFLYDNCVSMTLVIQKAVNQGKLPVPHGTPRDYRLNLIKMALRDAYRTKT